MILLCEHPACAGCESAQSTLRSSLCRCSTNCRRSRCSRSGVHKRGNRPSTSSFKMWAASRLSLLFAYITGPDLRCISDPDLVPQILDQLNEPLTVARSFHADQHRCSQLLIELLGLTPGMH